MEPRREEPRRDEPKAPKPRPEEKRKRFLLGVFVRTSECFDRVRRYAQLQKDLAISLGVAGLDADRDRTSVGNLFQQDDAAEVDTSRYIVERWSDQANGPGYTFDGVA